VKENFISVTEAARNFADCVNRARYQNAAFVLLKNGAPVARLIPSNMPDGMPDHAKICSGRDLAEVLTKTKFPEETAKAWRHDLRAARKALKHPAAKW
jgi:antitoxin (DNA-binding transcriptional repressor) of toxin-antitoxin stability system